MTAVVVELVADQGVVVTSFLANSPSALEALKSATLLKSLSLNVLISGEHGTGKKSLATHIFPLAPIVNAKDFDTLLETIKEHKEVIVTNFEKLANADLLKKLIEETKTRIVATSAVHLSQSLYDSFFSITVHLPPLSERPEDVKPLCQKFLEENRDLLGEQPLEFCDKISFDLSENAHSLKRSLMTQVLFQSLEPQEFMQILKGHLFDAIEGNNAYRDQLHLFEVPLIQAGLEKYKSQFKLAEVLGINRNTLRKKIKQYSEDLTYE